MSFSRVLERIFGKPIEHLAPGKYTITAAPDELSRELLHALTGGKNGSVSITITNDPESSVSVSENYQNPDGTWWMQYYFVQHCIPDEQAAQLTTYLTAHNRREDYFSQVSVHMTKSR